MKVENIFICRLCFKVCESFQKFDENSREVLNFLLLILNISISKEPVVCDSCIISLQKCCDFKVRILHMLSIQNMPLSKETNTTTITCISNFDSICSFCMQGSKNEFSTLIKNENLDIMLMLGRCYPELQLNFSEDSKICAPCYECLQHNFSFVSTCLNVEEKINKYCETEGTDSKGQVELSKVLYSITKDVGNYENSYSGPNVVYIKEECFEQEEKEGLQEVKNEDEWKAELLTIKSDHVAVKEEVNDIQGFQPDVLLLKQPKVEPPTTDKQAEQTTVGRIGTSRKTNPERRMLPPKNIPVVAVNKYKCKICVYQTLRKRNLTAHMLSHKETTVYKCDRCDYNAKRKTDLRRHSLTHKNTSEVTMHKCEKCTFESKYKFHVSRHMLSHSNKPDDEPYSCETCTFTTVHKPSIARHSLTHQSPPGNRKTDKKDTEAKYMCDICGHQTDYTNNLKKHMLSHKNLSETPTFKCGLCTFETKYKYDLPKHMLIHKKTSELTLYKCEMCSYQSKYKHDIRKHMLTHKSISEVKSYKCETCGYETKYRFYLKRHRLTHKNPFEVTMHKCSLCPYQTKHKETLPRHMLIHRSPLDLTVFKCHMCEYQTKRKHDLRRHILTHQST